MTILEDIKTSAERVTVWQRPSAEQLALLLQRSRPAKFRFRDAGNGPPGVDGTDSYVLGEINVSSVFPIPDEASAEIVRRVADRLRSML